MLALLAQAKGGGGGEAVGMGLLMFFLMIFVGVCLVAMLPQIFFLLTLSKALNRCSDRNRTQEPGMVWLALIPVVGFAWMFINVLRIAESLENEYRDRGWHRRGEDYGHGLGITYCCLYIGLILPYCGILFGLAGFVCWIIYWVKIANLSSQIENPHSGGRRRDRDDDYDDDDDDDDDDDRRRRRRRDRDDD